MRPSQILVPRLLSTSAAAFRPIQPALTLLSPGITATAASPGSFSKSHDIKHSGGTIDIHRSVDVDVTSGQASASASRVSDPQLQPNVKHAGTPGQNASFSSTGISRTSTAAGQIPKRSFGVAEAENDQYTYAIARASSTVFNVHDSSASASANARPSSSQNPPGRSQAFSSLFWRPSRGTTENLYQHDSDLGDTYELESSSPRARARAFAFESDPSPIASAPFSIPDSDPDSGGQGRRQQQQRERRESNVPPPMIQWTDHLSML